MAEEKKTCKFVCTVCGYEVEVDTPELPEDYVCPVCGVGPDQLRALDTPNVSQRGARSIGSRPALIFAYALRMCFETAGKHLGKPAAVVCSPHAT